MSSNVQTTTPENRFDFHYGNESEQYSFFKVPKILFSDEPFMDMSIDAKLLYSLMLDRMSLSRANGWTDSENKIYIIFPISTVIDILRCGKGKAVKMMKELEEVGLIERERRGLGKPDLIYVKKFTDQTENPPRPHKEIDPETGDYIVVNESIYDELFPESTSEYPKINSCVPKNEPQEFSYLDTNNTENIKTDCSSTEFNNFFDIDVDVDKMRAIDAMYAKIREKIGYSDLARCYGRNTVDSFVENLAEIAMVHDDGGMFKVTKDKQYPISFIKYRFMNIDNTVADYILDSLRHTKNKVAHLKKYMITTLFNAPSTIDTKYQLEANHDMANGALEEFMRGRAA